MAFQAVCDVDDLPIGGMRTIRRAAHGSWSITWRTAGSRHSCGARIRSVRSPRGEIVDSCQVQCPLHRARFDIATGKVIQWANFPPGIELLEVVRGEKPLRTLPARVKNGKVLVKT